MGVRSSLAVGAAAVAATALVATPPPVERPVETRSITVSRIDLAAASAPVVVAPSDPGEFAAARDAITRLAPTATLSATGDWISSAYQFVMYWASYGVDLANYVLQFIPFGYLISAQVNIVYDTLVVPISSSFVYDLAIPVVNDPLNIWSYINGLAAVGSTTVVSLINAGIAEFNYFFGWLIPPLPPLPLAAEATVEDTPEVMSMAAELEDVSEPEVLKDEPEVQDGAQPETLKTEPEVVEPEVVEPEVVEAEVVEPEVVEPAVVEAAVVEPEVVAEEPEPTPTVDSKGGVSAQGEVRTGGQTATPEKAPDATDTKGGEGSTDTVTPSATATPPAATAPDSPKSDEPAAGDKAADGASAD